MQPIKRHHPPQNCVGVSQGGPSICDRRRLAMRTADPRGHRLAQDMGGKILAPGQGTCKCHRTGEMSQIDFYVLDARLAPAAPEAKVAHSALSPHSPVHFKANQAWKAVKVLQLKRPKTFPKERPLGPVCPASFPDMAWEEGITQDKLDVGYSAFSDGAEEEVTSLLCHTVEEARAHSGRKAAPTLKLATLAPKHLAPEKVDTADLGHRWLASQLVWLTALLGHALRGSSPPTCWEEAANHNTYGKQIAATWRQVMGKTALPKNSMASTASSHSSLPCGRPGRWTTQLAKSWGGSETGRAKPQTQRRKKRQTRG